MAKSRKAIDGDMLLEDSESSATPEQMALVVRLVQEQLDAETEVANLEQSLKDAKAVLLNISDKLLPSAMQAARMEEYRTTDKQRVFCKPDMSVSLGEAHLGNALAWLRSNNMGGLISNTITITIPKGADVKKVEALKHSVEKTKFTFAEKETVNTATFKATLKRALEDGKEVDLQSVGAYSYTRATIKQS